MQIIAKAYLAISGIYQYLFSPFESMICNHKIFLSHGFMCIFKLSVLFVVSLRIQCEIIELDDRGYVSLKQMGKILFNCHYVFQFL